MMEQVGVDKLIIERLTTQDIRTGFCCGVESLDTYLTKQASQEKRRYVSVPYVLLDDETKKVIGYYTLAATTIQLHEMPEFLASKLPYYPLVPATLLGRLAIDKAHQGQGLGELLMIDGLLRAYHTSRKVASYAVVVDSINTVAVSFYKKYGFAGLNAQNRLFLPMAQLAKFCKEDL